MVNSSLASAKHDAQFHVIDDATSGVTGVIAVHSLARGPAAGGCRFWHYDNPEDMTRDAARLARGMSYKNAMARLPFGGGKAVLQRPSGSFDRTAIFRAFAHAVAALKGDYITAEDVGTTIDDMHIIRDHTRYVAGLEAMPGKAGGDPSPWTALGVFGSMQVASQHRFGSGLGGLTIAVQGVGNVGAALCGLLHDAGAKLIVADADEARAVALGRRFGARVVDAASILSVEADVLAPCALGAILNDRTIPELRVGMVCGAANNQLATDEDGTRLVEREIVYAPDYVVNAGGIINVSAEYLGETIEQVRGRIDEIGPRVITILQNALADGVSPRATADGMAEQIIADAERAVA